MIRRRRAGHYGKRPAPIPGSASLETAWNHSNIKPFPSTPLVLRPRSLDGLGRDSARHARDSRTANLSSFAGPLFRRLMDALVH